MTIPGPNDLMPKAEVDALRVRDKVNVRLDAWRSIFERTNRIISEKPVNVRIVDPTNSPEMIHLSSVPGWSDGETIFFNRPFILDRTSSSDMVDAVLTLKGLNYHELSHVMFTPRSQDDLHKQIVERHRTAQDEYWWWAYNALEDQRIETWFTTLYNPSRRYFEATILRYLMESGTAEAAILIYGRKFLPARLRVQAGRVFVKKYDRPLYNEFKAVIDSYLKVRLPADTTAALTIIGKYRDLLLRMDQKMGAMPPLPINDNAAISGPSRSAPDIQRRGRITPKASKDAQGEMDKVTDKAQAEDAQAEVDLVFGKDAGQQDGGTAAGQQQGKDQNGSSQGDSSSNAGTSADASDGAGGSGAGEGHAHHEVLEADLAQAIDNLIGQARDAMTDVVNDDQVLDDVDAVMDAVKAAVNKAEIEAEGPLAKSQNNSLPPTAATVLAKSKVKRILTRIRQDVEPSHLHRQTSGRVDARRVMGRKPHEIDIFRRWDEGGEDKTGLEAVVLVDVSGSMSNRMIDSSMAVWALKKSFDAMEIRCTVMVYDTSHQVLYQGGEKAGPMVPVVNSGGGTDPTSAIEQAHRILTRTKEPNAVLVTVTDGSWRVRPQTYQRIRSMNAAGVSTLLLGLDRALESYGSHHHTYSHSLNSINDLPKAVLKLVAGIMRNAAARA